MNASFVSEVRRDDALISLPYGLVVRLQSSLSSKSHPAP